MGITKYLRVPHYDVGTYKKEYDEKIQRLFRASFGGREESKEMLEWQIEKNPCLSGRATTLWQDDTLVGFNVLTPHPAILNGQNIVSAVSGTTMADVHFPGASLQLFRECAAQNEDIQVIYGFPNVNSYDITVKYIGHHYVGDVAFWTAKSEEKPSTDNITEKFEFCDTYEQISRELARNHIFIKTRKKEFLNWRFFEKPGYEYHLYEYANKSSIGYIVVDTYEEKNTSQLQIIDILANDDEAFEALLSFSKKLAFRCKCSYVKLWLTSSKYKELLEGCGFVYGEHPFPMTVWSQEMDIHESYITMVDSDIF